MSMEFLEEVENIIKKRFGNYTFLKLPIYGQGYPNDDYYVEYTNNKCTVSYYDERGNQTLIITSDMKVEIISALTNIYSKRIAYFFSNEFKLNCIDSRILIFAKHVDLLFKYREYEYALKQMDEYTKLLGYNIFEDYEDIKNGIR